MDQPFAHFRDELASVRAFMLERLAHEGPPSARHMLERFPMHAGQGLRPSLVLAAAALRGPRSAIGPAALAAAAVELVHNGSLLHDDVIDGAEVRRHLPTINRAFGTTEAVLLGDFLLSRALVLAGELGDPRGVGSLTRLIRDMVDGELLELERTGDPGTTHADAWSVMRLKTGSLFGEACFLGGLVAGLDDDALERLRTFGQESGCAYQIADDLLDATSSCQHLGKTTGLDADQGKPTLPLVHALALAPDDLRERFRTAPAAAASEGLGDLLRDPRVVRPCLDCAREASERALGALAPFPPTPGLDALRAFAAFGWRRAEDAAR